MKPLDVLADALRPVVDLVYPPRCPLCGDAIEQQSGLCAICWAGLEVPGEPNCSTCQRPLPGAAAGEGVQCGQCLQKKPRHSGIAAATVYNETSRQLVLRYKHGGRIALAGQMARLMMARLGELPENAVLVPVPLHRWRLWKRGYNQAALLAQEIGKLSNSDVCVDALLRKKRTPSLGGLGWKARKQALTGAIAATEQAGRTIHGKPVILVDDVLTSGATSNACVSALLKAGAGSVRIACFARVLSEAERGRGTAAETETPEAARTSGAT